MKRIIFFAVLLIPFVIFAKQKTLFTGPLDFSELSSDIVYSHIFKNAPQTTGSQFNYMSVETPSQMTYSKYHIGVESHFHKLSQYQTIEMPPDDTVPQVRGDGIGYGGIVSLAYEKGQTAKVNPPRSKWGDFYKKFEIVKITDVSGKLFPLKVGNQLSFDYTAYVKTYSGMQEEQGEYVYQVVRKQQGYQGSENPVIGPVYVIKLMRKTRSQPALEPMNEYYFSTKLGWYVQATYYRQGQAVVVYRLVNWS